MKWLFVTAAIGSDVYSKAAHRLVMQARLLNIFDDYVVVDLATIENYWPGYQDYVPEKDWCLEHNFGNYIWKPIIAEMAISGFFGQYDGICYLDAGCEILPSVFSKYSFKRLMRRTEKYGLCVFSTGAPELSFTKNQVFMEFKDCNRDDQTDQIAAGSWLFSGPAGERVIRRWVHVAKSGYQLINSEVSPIEENSTFISTRHDQSIFSLACKQFNYKPQKLSPPGSANTIKSAIGNFFFAFRWARNRSGMEVNPIWLRRLGLFSLLKLHEISHFVESKAN